MTNNVSALLQSRNDRFQIKRDDRQPIHQNREPRGYNLVIHKRHYQYALWLRTLNGLTAIHDLHIKLIGTFSYMDNVQRNLLGTVIHSYILESKDEFLVLLKTHFVSYSFEYFKCFDSFML